MAKPFIILSTLLLTGTMVLSPNLHAQETWVSVNPGVKLAYEFGSNSGFVFGAEISLVVMPNRDHLYYWGIVASVDRCQDLTKYLFGIEGGSGLVGLCIGPSFLSRDGIDDIGVTITPYAGAILIPYFSFTGSSKFGGINEVGSFIKIPLLVRGELSWD